MDVEGINKGMPELEGLPQDSNDMNRMGKLGAQAQLSPVGGVEFFCCSTGDMGVHTHVRGAFSGELSRTANLPLDPTRRASRMAAVLVFSGPLCGLSSGSVSSSFPLLRCHRCKASPVPEDNVLS